MQVKEIQTMIFRQFHMTISYTAILEKKKNKTITFKNFFSLKLGEVILDLKVDLKSNSNVLL